MWKKQEKRLFLLGVLFFTFLCVLYQWEQKQLFLKKLKFEVEVYTAKVEENKKSLIFFDQAEELKQQHMDLLINQRIIQDSYSDLMQKIEALKEEIAIIEKGDLS